MCVWLCVCVNEPIFEGVGSVPHNSTLMCEWCNFIESVCTYLHNLGACLHMHECVSLHLQYKACSEDIVFLCTGQFRDLWLFKISSFRVVEEK